MAEYIRGPQTLAKAQAQSPSSFPEQWVTRLYEIAPRVMGKAPMTALMLASVREEATSQKVHWGEISYPVQTGPIRGVYTSDSLSVPVSTRLSKNAPVVLALSADAVSGLIQENKLQVSSKTVAGIGVNMSITGINASDDTHSYVTARLNVDDTAGVLASQSETNILKFANAGSRFGAGFGLPKSVSRSRDLFVNYVTNQAASYSYDGEEKEELERFTPDFMTQAQKECLSRWMDQAERNLIFSFMNDQPGSNGNIALEMDGLYSLVAKYCPRDDDGNPANIINLTTYKRAPERIAPGSAWASYGLNALNGICDELQMFSQSPFKTVWCDSTVFHSLRKLTESWGDLQITPSQNSLGMNIKTLIGLNQEWKFTQHPQFDMIPALKGMAYVTERAFTDIMPKAGQWMRLVGKKEIMDNIPGILWRDSAMAGFVSKMTVRTVNTRSQAWIYGWGQAAA